MFKLLVQKELRAIIQSPKFAVTFLVCSLLLMFSVFIGIAEYRQAVTQYETAGNLARQSMEESTSWQSLSDKTYRKPQPLEVFVSGLGYDIGRWSEVNSDETVKLKHSAYSDDPIFAVFRIVDFTFIVQIVFSLFAILFTYDAINGERENGTLRLVFANAVPRATYIMAKAVGTWLGLMAPLSIPILLSLLLVQIYSVPLSGSDWILVAVLVALSLLYVTLFVFFGVLMSTLSKHSSVSFLFSLVLWVAFVLIIPRAGVMASGSLVDVPSLAEVEGVRGGYAKDRWSEYYAESERRWLDMEQHAEIPDDERSQEQIELAMWQRMKQEDSARKMVKVQIEDYERQIMTDWQHRKQAQQRFGFTLSRLSPASAYQLAAMQLARTDIDLKSRYQSSIDDYRTRFNDYVDARQAESGQQGGVMINFSTEDGFSISTSRDNSGLDLSDKPEFEHTQETVPEVIEAVVIDFGLLALGTLLSFMGAFVAFLRYDMR